MFCGFWRPLFYAENGTLTLITWMIYDLPWGNVSFFLPNSLPQSQTVPNVQIRFQYATIISSTISMSHRTGEGFNGLFPTLILQNATTTKPSSLCAQPCKELPPSSFSKRNLQVVICAIQTFTSLLWVFRFFDISSWKFCFAIYLKRSERYFCYFVRFFEKCFKRCQNGIRKIGWFTKR